MFTLEVYTQEYKQARKPRYSVTGASVPELVSEAARDFALTPEQGRDVCTSLGLGVVGRWRGARAELHIHPNT